ncbi:MAG: hypothetical protein ACJ789_04840 [Thermomicrobiales bacterium]
MHKPTEPQSAATTAGGQLVLSDRLASFKRTYRWLNLTLVQQATWPLILVLTSAPAGTPDEIPMPWYLFRLAGPTFAAVLAFIYLKERPLSPRDADVEQDLEPVQSPAATQVRLLLLGLPLMVLVARLLVGPVEPVLKIGLFGLANVAAYHLINFGVVARSFPDPARGQAAAILFFGLSWGMEAGMLTAFGPESASPVLAFFAGLAAGIVVAICCRALRRWPGRVLTAPAAHWLVVYLIFGFVN